MKRIESKLRKLLPGIKKNILLKNYTTFKIGGPAKYFYLAKTKEDLIKAITVAKKLKLPFFILGGGSNLLVADEGYKGLLINFQFSIFNFQKTQIIAGAGLPLGKLVNISIEKGLTGLEWAVGIPGTIGGAVYGNAGAFGKSMADIIKKVEVFDTKNLRLKSYDLRNCKFGYRESIFKIKQNLLILSTELKLKKGNKEKIKEKIQNYLNYRKERHPKESSAGSVFKNVKLKTIQPNFFKKFPEAKKVIKENILPTAFLIAQCDLVGKKIGGVAISEKHPNFIVNLGKAKAKDVRRLINLIKNQVKNKFGITLKEEIQYLPR